MDNVSTVPLTMERTFNEKPESVYEAWVNPDMMRKWLFTLEGTNKLVQNDPKVGGSWEIIDHREGVDYRAVGEYLELNAPNQLVFTFKMPQFSELEDKIKVEIIENASGAQMTFTQLIHVEREESWTDADMEKRYLSTMTQPNMDGI